MPTSHAHAATEKAIFAGGCFWCIEAELEKLPGVLGVVSGYTGGREENPTYDQVSSKKTSHIEAVEVTFDPAQIPYARLLEAFWDNIDPTDDGGQFYDRGQQYTTAIFYMNEAQKNLAENSKAAKEEKIFRLWGKKIATAIRPATTFYAAEDYHQNYYQTNPTHYNAYKTGSGREEKLKKIWGSD
ncbi:MAG: peptide-methionine (S)-S-oxide reductase [Alphaproteobacteria bacterium]|nr:peptide-methionine (S)-S-oxide reductase [Alphaproteobacteria bacterium]